MKHRTMKAGKEQPISPRLASELGTMFYYHPPKMLSRNLRKMFMDYVIRELEVGASDYCEELILGLNWLFNFLDVAEEEMDVKECSTGAAICSTDLFGEPRGSLDSAIKFIVAMVLPERIYSLEYADPMDNEDGNYYDLLVVLPDASQRPFRHYEVLIELCCFGNERVSCSLHQSTTLNRYISEGNLFYSSVCRDEHLLYGNKASSLPSPDPAKLEEARERAGKTFMVSYRKASSFLEGAKGYFEKGTHDICVFMLQQAAELTLRGVILAYTGKDVRTHSITELLKNCRRVAPQLHLIFRGKGADSERLLELLEGAYKDSRYGERYDVKAEDVGELMKRIELLLVRAKEIFE